ncbi:MAG TPA: hypothetical protein ENO22_12360 [candidate division Zixibacteria bacterium]|nr:hypothetical protein [candidate division Zixibacteria bacterium]
MSLRLPADNHLETSLNIDDYLTELPENLVLNEDTPQEYRITTVWHNRDLQGNATAKFIISGQYTRALEGDSVQWNNVMIEIFPDPSKAASDTAYQEFMEGFKYKSPEDIARYDFFKDFPSDESTHLLRTLIWDAVAFEVFGWNYFDQLELNKAIVPSDLVDFDAPMADWGTITMKNLKLIWVGVSELNNELCAVIDYESFVNPVNSSSPGMTVQGRSLYWGIIYISLEDKQIEYATMNEDVIMEITTLTNPENRVNIQREVKFEKLR